MLASILFIFNSKVPVRLRSLNNIYCQIQLLLNGTGMYNLLLSDWHLNGKSSLKDNIRKTDSTYSYILYMRGDYWPRLLIGRYRRMLPRARTALDLTLSLSWQAFIDVVNNFCSSRSEKSFMKSLSHSILQHNTSTISNVQ